MNIVNALDHAAIQEQISVLREEFNQKCKGTIPQTDMRVMQSYLQVLDLPALEMYALVGYTDFVQYDYEIYLREILNLNLLRTLDLALGSYKAQEFAQCALFLHCDEDKVYDKIVTLAEILATAEVRQTQAVLAHHQFNY